LGNSSQCTREVVAVAHAIVASGKLLRPVMDRSEKEWEVDEVDLE